MKRFLLTLTLPLISMSLFAQHSGAVEIIEEEDIKISYIPQVFGAVKAKLEFSLYDGHNRFNVRNSRIGVKGLVSRHINYLIQVDYSNEGKIAVMDAWAGFTFDRLKIILGQQQYHFSTDLDRGPNTNFFANRSFLSKYLTTYFGANTENGIVTSIGSRDLGIYAEYVFPIEFPLGLSLGAFSGAGANNPEWNPGVNIVTRMEIGPELGFGGAVSHYNGKTNEISYLPTPAAIESSLHRQRIRMWGAELHFRGEDFLLEAEYAQRRLKNEEDLHLLQAGHVQGYYQFRLGSNCLAMDYIAPVARWDIGHNIEFLNMTNSMVDTFTANRATVGVNFGFIRKIVGAELRLNFEKYFFGTKPTDYSVNRLMQDKFTLEIVATF